MDKNTSAEIVLSLLKQGNSRFAEGDQERFSEFRQLRIKTSEQGQQPSVAILSCSDSRVPVELLFDCGIGEIFVVRVAGNIVGESELGSFEYAVERLGISVLLVMGHTQCGAVQAAVHSDALQGRIGELVGRISPAVARIRTAHPLLGGPELIEAVVHANVWQSMADLLDKSRVIKEAVVYGRVKLLGACYDIRQGLVNWMGEHPEQWQLLARVP